MSSLLLCITAGRGPVECRQAVDHVFRAMCREAEAHELVVSAEAYEGWPGSIILSLGGERAEAFATSWVGTIQWVTKSSLRSGVGRKNWFVAVKRLSIPQKLPELGEVAYETLRAGGPGGQHQNKTESAVRAIHLASGTAVVARDGRSQHRNKALALLRLQQLLAAINERHQSKAAAQDWAKKITVERGQALRVYQGIDFVRRREVDYG